jgi:hypothetical protein
MCDKWTYSHVTDEWHEVAQFKDTGCRLCGIFENFWPFYGECHVVSRKGVRYIRFDNTPSIPDRFLQFRLDPVIGKSLRQGAYTIQHTQHTQPVRIMADLLPENTADEACFETINGWIKNCVENHVKCKRTVSVMDKFQLPTRLLDITKEDNCRLVSATSLKITSTPEQYATLSHRWARNGMSRLLRENEAVLMEGIHTTDLPLVFQDAITVARRLSLHYLWIDALCIVQDDAEDWKKRVWTHGTSVS